MENEESRNTTMEQSKPKGVRLRKNVLLLMLIAYSALLIVFGVLAWQDSPTKAYEVISGPFIALIGGTLAIAKDLVDN